MLESIIKVIIWDPDAKKLKKYRKDLLKIREFESQYSDMSLDNIKTRTSEIKTSFAWLDFTSPDGTKAISEGLENIKHEAGALWLRACTLISWKEHSLGNGKTLYWNMLPYDVQVIGGLALHDGSISEMKTGEWKTLVATFAAYLNALSGNPVHIVTVNDYLAERDSVEMSVLYEALGLTVWVVSHNQSREDKKENYTRDVIYATNNELGFDYLRDNMAVDGKNISMSPRFFAIIDEVDSVLIDITKNQYGGLLSFGFLGSIFLMTNGVNAIFGGFEYSYHVK